MAPKKQQTKEKKQQSTKKVIILDTKAKILAAKQAKYGAPTRKKEPPTQSELRSKKKAEEEAKERELRMLFKPVPDKKEAERKKKEKEDREARERGEIVPPDPDDPYSHLKDQSEGYLWNPEDFEPIEMSEAKLEEELQKELEALRAKLECGEIVGTKVTPETFAKWKQEKREQKAVEDRKKRKQMIKTGHMTGRMLYDLNSAVFVDDEDGMVEYEREVDDAETEQIVNIKEIAEEFDASLFQEDEALLEIEDIEDDEGDVAVGSSPPQDHATSSSSSNSSSSSSSSNSSSSSCCSKPSETTAGDEEGSDEGGAAVVPNETEE